MQTLQVQGAFWVAQTLHGLSDLEVHTKEEQKSIACPRRKETFVPQASEIITYQGSRFLKAFFSVSLLLWLKW